MNNTVQLHQNKVTAILPQDYETAWRMSKAIAASGLAPKGIQTPEAIFTAIQMGAEVGLSPMQALQNIAVVNGRPTIWGDAQLGLVRGSGLLESFEERLEGEGDKRVAICIVKRRGDPVAITGKFSVTEAKTAGLWGKQGPWIQYPERMLKMRARGFALRDGFSDILKGIYSREEMEGVMQDITPAPVQSVNDLNAEFITPVTKNEVITPDGEIIDQENSDNYVHETVETQLLSLIMEDYSTLWFPTELTAKKLAENLMNQGWKAMFKSNNSPILDILVENVKKNHGKLGETIEKQLNS